MKYRSKMTKFKSYKIGKTTIAYLNKTPQNRGNCRKNNSLNDFDFLLKVFEKKGEKLIKQLL